MNKLYISLKAFPTSLILSQINLGLLKVNISQNSFLFMRQIGEHGKQIQFAFLKKN